MSMDAMVVVIASKRWRHAQFIRLPQDASDPVIFVDEDDRLDMYHPALRLELKTAPQAWTTQDFDTMVSGLLPKARQVITEHLAFLQLPKGYYSDYPRIVKYTMQLDEDT